MGFNRGLIVVKWINIQKEVENQWGKPLTRSDMIYLSWWNFHIYFSLLEGVCKYIYIYVLVFGENLQSSPFGSNFFPQAPFWSRLLMKCRHNHHSTDQLLIPCLALADQYPPMMKHGEMEYANFSCLFFHVCLEIPPNPWKTLISNGFWH